VIRTRVSSGLLTAIALILLLALMAIPVTEAMAATMYEHYDTGAAVSGVAVYSGQPRAQTFTAESSHAITSVSLQLSRFVGDGIPGIITVSIRATDSNGYPTGGDLASGTTDGSTLPNTVGSTVWREIALSPCLDVTVGEVYAIVVSNTGGSGNRITWWGPGTNGYSGGSKFDCCWTRNPNLEDNHFRIYGTDSCPQPQPVGGEAYPINRLGLIAPWIALASAVGAASFYIFRRRVHSWK
jgi:hypothetical protein